MPTTQMSVPGTVTTMYDSDVIGGQSIYATSAVQKHRLGSRIALPDGRVFYYAKAGATNLVAGKLCCSPAPVANHTDVTVAAAAAVGDTKLYITIGATSMSANQYADGYLHANANAPAGNYYKIRSHLAIGSSGSGWIHLYDPIQEAFTTSSKVTLTVNPFNGVVAAATSLTAPVVGVPIIDVTASHYFWLQTWGPAAVLTYGTIVIGQNVGPSGSSAGAVAAVAASTTPVVGFVAHVNGDGEHSLIFLRLFP
ncbi:MAG: hypothetical protein QXQ53_04850 [Candidatus Methanosuratincola sp.]